MFALVRAEHPIKREDLDAAMVPEAMALERVDNDLVDLGINVFTAFSFDAVQQVLQGRRDVLVGGLRRRHGPGHRPLDPRDGRARAPHLPRARAAGVQPQGDGDVGARPRRAASSTSSSTTFIDRRPRPTSSRELTFPFPVARDRAAARPAARRPADVPPPGGRAHQRRLRPRARDSRRRRRSTTTSARSSPTGASTRPTT